jgi:hypothetical protein
MYDCKTYRWGDALDRAKREVDLRRTGKYPAWRVAEAEAELASLTEAYKRSGRTRRDPFHQK